VLEMPLNCVPATRVGAVLMLPGKVIAATVGAEKSCSVYVLPST